MTLLTRRALVMGILYMAFFEGLLANIPMGVRLVTVIYYTRLIAYRSMAFRLQPSAAKPRHGRRSVAA
jgi:hypothetical protein